MDDFVQSASRLYNRLDEVRRGSGAELSRPARRPANYPGRTGRSFSWKCFANGPAISTIIRTTLFRYCARAGADAGAPGKNQLQEIDVITDGTPETNYLFLHSDPSA